MANDRIRRMDAIADELLPEHPKDEYVLTRQMRRRFVIHSGATNSGKTFSALEALKQAESGIYLAPLRLLALEIYTKLNRDGCPCSLLTGEEEVIVGGARHQSSTIEKLTLNDLYDVAVIDEGQMVYDRQRGGAWARAILGVRAGTVYVCCAPNATKIIARMAAECGDSVEIVEHERQTELAIEGEDFRFPFSVQKGDALVVFSKAAVLRVANALAEAGKKPAILYGGLPPRTRKRQMDMFLSGEVDVVVCTDVIGMGVNLPIRRVVFMDMAKYDGESRRFLNPDEVKQIAGRAGRRGMYDKGCVNCAQSKDKKYLIWAFNAKQKDIDAVYITPLDSFIVNFPFGTLAERLRAWERHTPGSYFRRADLSEPLFLLGIYNSAYRNELTLEEQYKAIFLPFDSANRELLAQWKSYVACYIRGNKIPFPKLSGFSLDDYEQYYKALDLYYSFNKAMGLPMDTEKVEEHKWEASEAIHVILKEKIREMKHKCRTCGRALPWNHFYNECDACFEERMLRRYECDW